MLLRFFSLAMVWICFLAGCQPPNERPAALKPAALESIEAEVIKLQLTTWPKIVRSQGSLYVDEQVIVGAKVAGRVAEVHCDVGDLVKVDQPLVTLDQEDFRLQVEQSEAQLLQARASVGLGENDPLEKLDPENAPPVRQEKALWNESKSNLSRIAALRDNNAVTQSEYEIAAAGERVAEARFASAVNAVHEKIALIHIRQAELAIARKQLKDALILSPLEGFVLNRQAAPGAYLTMGQPVVVVVRSNPLRYRGTVPERYAQSLAVGQQVELRIESVDQPRTAEITRISPALDQQSRALTFEALLDNEDQSLRAGLFVQADIMIEPEAQALVVPESAISSFAGAEKAWIVVDGVAAEREIQIGLRRDQRLEVVQGLAVGDVILRDAKLGRAAKINQR